MVVHRLEDYGVVRRTIALVSQTWRFQADEAILALEDEVRFIDYPDNKALLLRDVVADGVQTPVHPRRHILSVRRLDRGCSVVQPFDDKQTFSTPNITQSKCAVIRASKRH